VNVAFRPIARERFKTFAPSVKRAVLVALNTHLFERVRKAASGSGFYYVEVTPELVAYLTVDAEDPELLWVLGFGPPP
jgi:hypothetical protein